MPSSSSPSITRSLLGPSRIELLEKRLAEVEVRQGEQQAVIDQQTVHIARQNQALQASETTNRMLQGRIDRLEKHVSTMESQLKLHDQLLYNSSPESP
jgi:predicted  nucleic acid-binding Zn-ribbon protein